MKSLLRDNVVKFFFVLNGPLGAAEVTPFLLFEF